MDILSNPLAIQKVLLPANMFQSIKKFSGNAVKLSISSFTYRGNIDYASCGPGASAMSGRD